MSDRELQELISRVEDGDVAQLVLIGAVGSGRTSTLRELASEMSTRGWTVVVLRPSADDAREREAAARALGAEPDQAHGHERLVGALVRAWSTPTEVDRLICIDDVDLLDDPTVRAVCAACRMVETKVVMTAIGVERLVDGLPEGRFHQLSAWEPKRIRELIRGTAARSPIPEVLDRLTSFAGGNPGAAVALAASLSEAQLLGFEPMLPVRFTVPLTVRLTSRVPVELRSAALLIACAPGAAPAVFERAGAALGVGDADFDALERAGVAETVRGGLALRPPGLGFAFEAMSTLGERRRTHHAVADAYVGVDDSRVLWHRALAAGEPEAELADHLEKLCEEASRAGGRTSASHLMLRASELSVSTYERVRRLAAAAEYAWLEGAPASSLRLLVEAEQLSADPDLRLRVAYVRGSIELAAGAEEHALRVMSDAVPAALERLPLFEATALLMRACDAAVTSGDVITAVALGRQAQNALARGADSASSVRLQLVAGTAKVLADDLEAGFSLVDDVRAVCKQNFDQSHALVGMRAALIAGDATALWSHADLAVDRLVESNNRGLIPFATARRALADVLLGRLRTAVDVTVSGIEESDMLGQENSRAEHLAVQALAYARAGDTQQATEAADLTLRLAFDYGLAWPGAIAVWALGELELGAGNPERAFERLTLLWHGNRFERHPLVATLAAAELVEAAVRADRPSEGDVAFRRLVAWARATGNAAVSGSVERCAALRSEDGCDVAESFQRALDLHREAERPFDEARTSLAYGAWLRRERRTSECRAPLRMAHERFESVGAVMWQTNAAQEMRASGDAALRPNVSRTGTHLTGQELTIARMVADGDSNRQVAERLSLSVRTVEYHLRNVFVKLGLRSRTELAIHYHMLGDGGDAR
ncbi:LuxR family transcriptional regulator [Mycobacterium sp. 21AC1]|uniref:helix-turn-helix transcriptional regulator n=1 Tax=[Mycobacterium] appelbergii TaxID=2939269 RepID=UPI002938F23D|nr:LuxR C-terminal-related transcriptional regulator [Mycobacterium sp. 21AC1]MDV3127319.1 LuxR family transcriptional regulator [Mycobacterium sp. 21AC1]